MWRLVAQAPLPAGLAHSVSAIALNQRRWAAWLLYTPQEEVRPWTPPSDLGWAMMSDVGSCRAGVPDALIQWRRARGETPPEPMLFLK